MQRLKQQIFVIQRKADGQYLRFDKAAWVDDVALAFLVSRTKYKGIIRVNLGRDLEDFEMIEAVPSLLTTQTEGD